MSKRQRGSEVSSQADVARRGLVSVNRLDYVLQPDLSVAVARSMKKHFFQQENYEPSQRAVCTINSGAEYVDPQNSYLSFQVSVSTQDQNLGIGSACNFIKSIILTSRSGDEIERIENVSDLAPILDRYMKSREWIETTGTMMGYQNTVGASGIQNKKGYFAGQHGYQAPSSQSNPDGRGIAFTGGFKKEFIIPLSCLCGLFRSFDRLLPSMLMSGLRFEIEFESAPNATDNSNMITAGNYAIHSPEIVLDQYQLTDSIMRVLNEESALRGLEIVFTTWYNHESLLGAASFNIQIRKAVSRALGIMTIVQGKRGQILTHAHTPFAARWKNYQIRLGSLYFPQQEIVRTGNTLDEHVNMQTKLYHHTLRGLGKFKGSGPCGVSLHEYIGVGGDTGSPAKSASLQCVYTDLERSNVQKLSGVPVNNARVVEVRGKLEAAAITGFDINTLSSTTLRINCYLHYVRLLRVFMQNIEVEE